MLDKKCLHEVGNPPDFFSSISMTKQLSLVNGVKVFLEYIT